MLFEANDNEHAPSTGRSGFFLRKCLLFGQRERHVRVPSEDDVMTKDP